MILIALGSNLDGPWGSPADTLDRALVELARRGVAAVARSRWYCTAPFGYVHQPAFVNGVAAVATGLSPLLLLSACHAVERAAGRRRGVRWGPRPLDLDLLAYNRLQTGSCARPAGRRAAGGHLPLTLPHPGLPERPFVLVPLREVAPGWRHPRTGETADDMLRRLPLRAAGGVLGPA